MKLTAILAAIALVSVVSGMSVLEMAATTGSSLRPVTVTLTVAVAVPPLPSEFV